MPRRFDTKWVACWGSAPSLLSSRRTSTNCSAACSGPAIAAQLQTSRKACSRSYGVPRMAVGSCRCRGRWNGSVMIYRWNTMPRRTPSRSKL